jgi:hypothetical protein
MVFYSMFLKGGDWQSIPINQSTATKGNLEGIFGVIFLLGL